MAGVREGGRMRFLGGILLLPFRTRSSSRAGRWENEWWESVW